MGGGGGGTSIRNNIVTFLLVTNFHLVTYVHCNLPVLADPPKAMLA